MEKKKIVDLIKLEVLGCINQKDSEALSSAKETEAEFPWKELGDYQNLAALLPIAQKLEFPAAELKDKVAMKLYEIRDVIKAKLDAKKAIEEPEPEIQVEELNEIEEEEEIQLEEISSTAMKEVESTTIKEVEIPQVSVAEKPEVRRTVEEMPARVDHRVKTAVDRDMVERTVREYLKSNLEDQLSSVKQSISKNFYLSLIFFIITLILIVVVFLMK
jgi:hypothetical protein